MRDYLKNKVKAAGLAGAGGIPLLIPLSLNTDDLFVILQRLDGLVLPGGGDIGHQRQVQVEDTLPAQLGPLQLGDPGRQAPARDPPRLPHQNPAALGEPMTAEI